VRRGRCSPIPVAWGALAVLAAGACAGDPPLADELGTVSQPIGIQKAFTRKIFVHVMPWFQVGGQHWSMNRRDSATGVAAYYSPMIGEYSSGDANVIEYQLLTMKYAGIDGVLLDWPGLSGAFDLPQNKANCDAIVNKTAAFGMEFGVVYEDQNAGSIDAAKGDMAYLRDNFFSRPNHIKVSGKPALLVFGPQKFLNAGDWSSILSVFPVKPTFFALWYNNAAGASADGKFAWLAMNGVKGVSDFDNGFDGVNHGLMIPVIYPGFNPYYAAGGWAGPTFKISYTLKPDNTEGGDTFQSTFMLGRYVGDPLQIATWNDYGEGTMVEPTRELGYHSLTTLQQAVGAIYTDAELKIVKMLFDQRKQFGAAKQADLDRASAALANLDVATACGVLGCTVPVHEGAGGGGGGAGGKSGGGGAGTGGNSGNGGNSGSTGGAGSSGSGAQGSGGARMGTGATGPDAGGGAAAGADQVAGDKNGAFGCAVTNLDPPRSAALALVAIALLRVIRRRRAG